MNYKIQYGQKTRAGNFIFSNHAHKSDKDKYLSDNILAGLGITADTPLENVKVRTQPGYRTCMSGPCEALSKECRDQLGGIGIRTIGQLLAHRGSHGVVKTIGQHYCNDAMNWINALAEALPHVVDPTHVIPARMSVDVEINGKNAEKYRELEEEVRGTFREMVQNLITDNISELINNAHRTHLEKKALELESQLAKIKCQLGGSADC